MRGRTWTTWDRDFTTLQPWALFNINTLHHNRNRHGQTNALHWPTCCRKEFHTVSWNAGSFQPVGFSGRHSRMKCSKWRRWRRYFHFDSVSTTALVVAAVGKFSSATVCVSNVYRTSQWQPCILTFLEFSKQGKKSKCFLRSQDFSGVIKKVLSLRRSLQTYKYWTVFSWFQSFSGVIQRSRLWAGGQKVLDLSQ